MAFVTFIPIFHVSCLIILSGYVPGQEEGNVDFVVQNNVGVLALEAGSLVDALLLLIKPGSPLLHQRIENARKLSRPASSLEIAEQILSFLPARGVSGVWQSAHSLHMQRLVVCVQRFVFVV